MSRDSDILTSIFASEVWMLVFEQFINRDGFEDIGNGINASPYFRTILGSKQTTVLFPKVFKYLAVNYENKPDDAYYEESLENFDEEDSDTGLPIGILRKLQGESRSVLKLRLVCKTWNKGVDQFYHALPYHYKMNHDFDCETEHRFDDSDSSEHNKYLWVSDDRKTNHWDFTDYTKFEGNAETWSNEQFICKEHLNTVRFLEHFDSTHTSAEKSRSPFIGRSLAIKELPSTSFNYSYINQAATPEDRVFWDTITSILVKYGHHIWYGDLSARNKFPSLVEYYRKVREWLSLMPNLKVLNITYPIKTHNPTFPKTAELKQLQKEIRNNPLPKLKNMTYLKTSRIPAQIFNELMKQNSTQLNTLQVSKNEFQRGYDLYSDSMSVANLKKLSLEICSKSEFNILSESLHNWTLETLYLDYINTAEYIEWSKLFTVMKRKFGDKITNLMITLPVAKTEKEIKELENKAASYRLNMPLVKRLKIEMGNQVPIDFILPMKNNLEILQVDFSCKVGHLAQKPNQTIKFTVFKKLWMESNIWELFPKLQQIYVRPDKVWIISGSESWTATREKWEKTRKDAAT